jgi:hypothetical protein
LDGSALDFIATGRAQQAGLIGTYSFASLRTGFIRTALRAGVPPHVVAHHAGIAYLQNVSVHRRRELLLTDNVAARVGL